MKVCVLCGGWSREREVSLRSGMNVYRALKKLGYDAELVDMSRNFEEQLEPYDVVFIMLHGNPGEDGSIQAYLELKEKAYTGSDAFASMLGLDKLTFKYIMLENGINVPPFKSFSYEDDTSEIVEQASKLGFPLIVKPRYEGSSVGTYIVRSEDELSQRIDELKEQYRYGLVEKFIKGKELTVGVLGTGSDAFALPILELRPIISEFYDYKAKYTKGGTEFILPAELDEETSRNIKEIALKVHNLIGARDFSRVDLIYADKPYVLEINTIPGMTDTSDLPAQAKAYGMEFEELVDFILKQALTRANFKL